MWSLGCPTLSSEDHPRLQALNAVIKGRSQILVPFLCKRSSAPFDQSAPFFLVVFDLFEIMLFFRGAVRLSPSQMEDLAFIFVTIRSFLNRLLVCNVSTFLFPSISLRFNVHQHSIDFYSDSQAHHHLTYCQDSITDEYSIDRIPASKILCRLSSLREG